MLGRLDLDVGFKQRTLKTSEVHICQYLADIARISPGLQHLSIRGILSGPMLDIISSMRNLSTLSLRSGSSLTVDAFVAVTALQYLTELELHVGHLDVDDILRSGDIPSLPSLKKLYIRAQAPVLELVLNNLPSGTLHTLRVEVADPGNISVPWSHIFTSVCNNAATTLQNLTVEYHVALDDLEDMDISNTTSPIPKTNIQIPFNDLRILCGLRALQSLVLDATLPPDICDEELETLIICWPNLELLNLGLPPTSRHVRLQVRSPMTPRSLNILATKAPKLTALVLPVDISGIDSATIPLDIPSQYALIQMTLGCPSMPDLSKMTPYINRLFPVLRKIDGLAEHEEYWVQAQAALQALS